MVCKWSARVRSALVIGCLCAGAVPLLAQDDSEVDSPVVTYDQLCYDDGLFGDDLLTRPKLLGDLFGARTALGAHGIALDVSSTQFYQGVASGGVNQTFEYFGRNDYYLNVNGEQAGLWKGLFVTLHGETRYGDTVNADTGAISPVNTAGLFPLPNGSITALTAVKFTQALSENLITFAGKINLLDEFKQPYTTGRGVDAFMNTSLAFPIAAVRQVPYSTLGAGMAILREGQPMFSTMILDTHNTPTTSGFESFFTNGAVIIARAETPVTILDRPGHQAIWGVYSSGTYNDLSPTAYLDPTYGQPVVTFGTDTGSWSMFYSADQAFYVDPTNPLRSWGLFTNIGLADDGPSPVRWSANVGLGGSSPIVTRPLDTFGIGYAYTGYSAALNNLAPNLLPINNDHAVELFYNYAVTPWFHLTPDLQVLVPARERTIAVPPQPIDTAIVLGLRAKIDF
ncbi:MAG: carbohydrate porin [Planctomycetaceae bacterium]